MEETQSWTQLQNLYDMGMIGRAEFARQRDLLLKGGVVEEPVASGSNKKDEHTSSSTTSSSNTVSAGGASKKDDAPKPRDAKEVKHRDADDEDDFVIGVTETAPDANGVKTVTEYRLDDSGQRVKTVRQVRVSTRSTSVKRSVLARRRIPKFGRCAGQPRGPEAGVTCHGDRVYLEVPTEEKKPQEAKKEAGANYTVSCRSCGALGDHWTMQCPYKDRLLDFGDLLAGGDGRPNPGGDEEAAKEDSLASGKPGRYKPPGARGGADATGSTMPGTDRSQEVSTTIRVTNLSEDTTEGDVRDLFSRFGAVQRVYLARNKMGQSRGFAFVSFYSRREAEKAMETLQGFGYDNLILRLEWAAPSRN